MSESTKEFVQVLNKWVVSRETLNIMGQIPNSEASIDDEKYFTIKATNYEEAKTLRDKIEAENYAAESINIQKLLSIINNIERSHGSSTISPALLKEKIKESLL